MKYTLTEKLNFKNNPVIVIKDKEIEVKADAESVLKLLDILNNNGEIDAALDAQEILFSEKDLKKLKSLNLQFSDFITVITAAISLALGEDPDEEETTQGEE